MNPLRYRVTASRLVPLMIVLAISACDSKPKATLISTNKPQNYSQMTTLQGLVVDDAGPVKTGLVRALSEQGRELAIVTLQDSARYQLEIPAGTALPLIIAYYPTANADDAQRMLTVAVHASASKYDINPASTRIAKQAKVLGGYSHANLVRAAESSGIVPANNKTTSGFRGDPTTQYGGWH